MQRQQKDAIHITEASEVATLITYSNTFFSRVSGAAQGAGCSGVGHAGVKGEEVNEEGKGGAERV